MNAAHLHLMINHIPVLGSVAVLVLILYSVLKKNRDVTRLTLKVAILIGLLSIPVFLSGEPAEDVIEHVLKTNDTFVERHEDFSGYALFMTELVAVVAVVGLVKSRTTADVSAKLIAALGIMAAVNAGMMGYTAYLGGQIMHTELREAKPDK